MGTHLQVFGSTLGLVRGGGERGGREGGREEGRGWIRVILHTCRFSRLARRIYLPQSAWH